MTDQRSTRKGGHYATGEVSVTTVLGILNKPALNVWLCKQFMNATIDGAKTFGDANKVVREISRKAMDIGIKVHTYVEHHGKGIVPIKYDDLMLYYKAYHQWLLDYKPKILENEITVASEKFGYKGTIDRIAMIDNKRLLVDLKTGKSIYDSVELQTSAYKQAYEEQEEKLIDETWILLLEKGENGLPTGRYQFEQLNYVPEIFNATLEIYKWQKSHK